MPQVDLKDWTLIKERGGLTKTGHVYRSQDGQFFLRTGSPTLIEQEVNVVKNLAAREFPVPVVVGIGQLSDTVGYFVETSVGNTSYADLMSKEYSTTDRISDELFNSFCESASTFFAAQIKTENIQSGPSQLRAGIQLQNVLEENPDVNRERLEEALTKAENALSAMPLVLTHGDFGPLNILERGIIDFEHDFIAPFGYDVVSAIIFQRFWDHPSPDGKPTMIRWDFSQEQIDQYLSKVDVLCREADIPPISQFFDTFTFLKSIWALAFEKFDDTSHPQFQRWHWRKRVMLYCADNYLANLPIESWKFKEIGLDR